MRKTKGDMVKLKLVALLVILYCSKHASLAQNSERVFADLLFSSLELPETRLPQLSLTTVADNGIVLPYSGGLLVLGYNYWLIPPDTNRLIISSLIVDEEKSIFLIIREKLGTGLFYKEYGAPASSLELFDSLSNDFYKMYRDENGFLLVGASDNKTTIQKFDLATNALLKKITIDYPINDLAPYKESVYLCAIQNNLALIDLKQNKL